MCALRRALDRKRRREPNTRSPPTVMLTARLRFINTRIFGPAVSELRCAAF